MTRIDPKGVAEFFEGGSIRPIRSNFTDYRGRLHGCCGMVAHCLRRGTDPDKVAVLDNLTVYEGVPILKEMLGDLTAPYIRGFVNGWDLIVETMDDPDYRNGFEDGWAAYKLSKEAFEERSE